MPPSCCSGVENGKKSKPKRPVAVAFFGRKFVAPFITPMMFKSRPAIKSTIFTWYFLTIAQPVKMTIAAASQSEIACIWDPWEVNEIFSNNYRSRF